MSLPERPDIFIVRKGELMAAYRNRCPHQGIALNWRANDFLDQQHAHIECKQHGALFELDSGQCIFGPCQGKSLEKIALRHLPDAIELILE